MKLTEKHLDKLARFVVPAGSDWAGVTIGGHSPSRLVRELEAAGLLKDEGMLVVDDGDGYGVTNADGSERMRRGYSVTDAGRVVLDGAEKRAARGGR